MATEWPPCGGPEPSCPRRRPRLRRSAWESGSRSAAAGEGWGSPVPLLSWGLPVGFGSWKVLRGLRSFPQWDTERGCPWLLAFFSWGRPGLRARVHLGEAGALTPMERSPDRTPTATEAPALWRGDGKGDRGREGRYQGARRLGRPRRRPAFSVRGSRGETVAATRAGLTVRRRRKAQLEPNYTNRWRGCQESEPPPTPESDPGRDNIDIVVI